MVDSLKRLPLADRVVNFLDYTLKSNCPFSVEELMNATGCKNMPSLIRVISTNEKLRSLGQEIFKRDMPNTQTPDVLSDYYDHEDAPRHWGQVRKLPSLEQLDGDPTGLGIHIADRF